MKTTKYFYSILFLLLLTTFGFARDVEERTLENMNSWKETFDINNKADKAI